MADWKSFVVQVPGKDLLEPVRNVLETLLVFLEVLKAILDTIKTFLVDFGNPIRALVEALIRLIEELFLALKKSGFFAYLDVPNPLVDPNFSLVSGGFQAFTERFKGSLFDSKDFNRPQPRVGSTKSGFVILMVDASDPFTLVKRLAVLLAFFGASFRSPRYEIPENLSVLPVGDKGDPITALAGAFATEIKAIQLRWTLPSTIQTPDAGFQTLVGQLAAEFVPPGFLIERSIDNPSKRINLTVLGDSNTTGVVEWDRPTFFFNRSGQPTTIREPLLDTQGDPVVKFQKYTILDATDIEGILGQLGRFRYVDTDVEVDQVYYYRVRAFSGDLKVTDNKITFPTTVDQLRFLGGDNRVLEWPAEDSDDTVVMGRPSGIVSVRIPKATDFDVIENLRRLFQTAFSLDFQLAAEADDTFDDAGRPTGDTSPIEVGKSSLNNLAGPVVVLSAIPIIGILAQGDTVRESFAPDATGARPELPWQNFTVRRQSVRLADAVASAMLEAGSTCVDTFRTFMQGPLPDGPLDNATGTTLAGLTNLEAIVFAYTTIDDEGNTTDAAAVTFFETFDDVGLRLNVQTVIRFLKSFTLGGVPPDWISVVPLRDIIPWAGEILYDLLDKIQALLDAFNGVMDEIRAFIDLIERKIAALERFIQFLIDILNLIESLQIGAFLLAVPDISGDIYAWADEIDAAGGDRPPSGPGGYSAGVSFAYVAPDIAAFKTAFSLIFG